MSAFQVYSIGCFIISGAHYVRNGPDYWYGGWLFLAIVLVILDSFRARALAEQQKE